jgi:arginase family enzyme
MSGQANHAERHYHILGVPLRTGSLAPGNENDAQAYRDADLLARLQSAGCRVSDDGDVAVPSYLPHHTIPPIRNWPGPRIVWDLLGERLAPVLAQPGHIPLLVGCDCSVVVGTAGALARVAPGQVHLLYVDGDFDDAAPYPTTNQSAAALAVWLLLHESPFWGSPLLDQSRVTVVGPAKEPEPGHEGLHRLSLADVRRVGPAEAARQALAGIPPDAAILLHFDVDVFREADFPAAYFPHPEGLNLPEGMALLGTILRDPRIRLIEVTEYASLRDQDRRWVGELVALLARGLSG